MTQSTSQAKERAFRSSTGQETKKAVLDKGSQSSHLTYIGDAEVGKNVNFGCGTITCNYDGANKYRTVIGDGAFIGSDSQLLAPVTVGMLPGNCLRCCRASQASWRALPAAIPSSTDLKTT